MRTIATTNGSVVSRIGNWLYRWRTTVALVVLGLAVALALSLVINDQHHHQDEDRENLVRVCRVEQHLVTVLEQHTGLQSLSDDIQRQFGTATVCPFDN